MLGLRHPLREVPDSCILAGLPHMRSHSLAWNADGALAPRRRHPTMFSLYFLEIFSRTPLEDIGLHYAFSKDLRKKHI